MICLKIKDGAMSTIYSEHPLVQKLGAPSAITRASHVEPDPTHPGQWLADMSPSGGPVLGPFALRSLALSAEIQWLSDNIFAPKKGGP